MPNQRGEQINNGWRTACSVEQRLGLFRLLEVESGP